ncbi:hypothetical protein ACFCXS_35240 [Streptomyces sp. NPDC056373]|uniref:hypothetical protein n=1 Tax=Streptomyces sp. NPDC056373 TaxID=3345798 RepID=UPI0035DF372D
MLVEVEKIATFPRGRVLAQVQTGFGRAAVIWRGDADAGPGAYFVEWTVDEAITWGRNARPAAGTGPEVRHGGHCVVLRGRLSPVEDGAAVLQVDDANILLDMTDPLPDGVDGMWVELFVDRDKIALSPIRI